MKLLRALIILFISLHANCDLSTCCFHTIAVYEIKIKPVHKRDGGLLFISDLKSEFGKGKHSQKIDGKFGSIKVAVKSFSLDGATLKNVSSVPADGLDDIKFRRERFR